jgi:hypothetical protein
MPDPPNVFISWSGERSKTVAQRLREWLPDVIQAARPWMSASDIDKGARWAEEISAALATTKAGIICLTRENLTAPWLLFEAGAIAKTNDPKTRVWTYVLDELKPEALPAPLKMFQATPADKSHTHELLRSINSYLDEPIANDRLDRAFEKNWDDLEKTLKNLPKTAAPPPTPPDPAQMTESTLQIVEAILPEIFLIKSEVETIRNRQLAEEEHRKSAINPFIYTPSSVPLNTLLAGTTVHLDAQGNLVQYATNRPGESAPLSATPPPATGTSWVARATRTEPPEQPAPLKGKSHPIPPPPKPKPK